MNIDYNSIYKPYMEYPQDINDYKSALNWHIWYKNNGRWTVEMIRHEVNDKFG